MTPIEVMGWQSKHFFLPKDLSQKEGIWGEKNPCAGNVGRDFWDTPNLPQRAGGYALTATNAI